MTVYCFDIDGTICTNTDGNYERAVPFDEVIQKVNRLYDMGHKIIFFTSRGNTTGIDWRELTEKQLSTWQAKYHELIMGKPSADVFVDDKGIQPAEFLSKEV